MGTPAPKRYLLGLLLLILAFNLLDRVALGMVLQNIKLDLHLTDTQLGLMSGISFAVFYALMGIPIARWADRGNRVMIISLAAALSSVLVSLFGSANSLLQLLLIRVGIGVGEAGCVPPAHSLISDAFERAERPKALAIYTLGQPLSFLLGFFGAGWLNELYGWRTTFWVLGTPGLLLAALAWLTLREPRLVSDFAAGAFAVEGSVSRQPGLASVQTPPLLQVARTLARNRTFRQLLLCLSILYFVGFGILQWQPTFFVRSYGMSSSAIGVGFALSYGAGGLIGSYLGGLWAARYAARQEGRQLKVSAIAIASFGVLSIATYLSPNPYVALGLMGVGSLALNAVNGPFFGTIQTLIPPRMRATAIAIVYFFANLIGLGLGPWAVGALSDALRPYVAEDSLRYALLLLAPLGYFWGAAHAWRASRCVTGELEDIERQALSSATACQQTLQRMPIPVRSGAK